MRHSFPTHAARPQGANPHLTEGTSETMGGSHTKSLAAGTALALFYGASRVFSLHWVSRSDWAVIGVLALFLLATEGLRESGYLIYIVRLAAGRDLGNRAICAALVGIAAILAAAVTNDVSLFVLVPVTLGICERRRIPPIRLIVVETMAANVGSMAMPWGNPQNLFLFHHFQLRPGAFYHLMLPPALVMSLLLCGMGWSLAPAGRGRRTADPGLELNHWIGSVSTLTMAVGTLHLLGVLAVPTWMLIAGALLIMALCSFRTILQTDWSLLALFGIVFAVVHGLQLTFAGRWMDTAFRSGHWIRMFGAAVGVSQGISNVPAALIAAGVMPHLAARDPGSEISRSLAALLVGVNVGGLGTPIASLANLIAARLFVRSGGSSREFYRDYWRLNLAGLAVFVVIGALTVSVW